MVTLEHAISDLHTVLAQEPTAPGWRRQVGRRLAAVREALADAGAAPGEAWLSARAGSTSRERRALRARVGAIGAAVLERLEPEAARRELGRLERDLAHHLQRDHDLVYDSVALEIGGSE